MRKIFQNFDLLSIPVVAGNSAIYFPDDRIYQGKRINRIFFFSSNENEADESGMDVVPQDFLNYLYISLFNAEKKVIVQNLSSTLLAPSCNVDLQINEVVDFTMSEMKVLPNSLLDVSKTYSLLIGFEYQEKIRDPFIEPTNAYRFVISIFEAKKYYKLSDFGTYALADKKIKRLTVHGITDGFLTIREKNGKVYNQMPLSLFVPFLNSEDSYLDNCSVDWDNSYLETFGIMGSIELTFYYD